MSTSKKSVRPLSLRQFLTVIGHHDRWRIFDELLKGETLPVKEIARRLNLKPTNTAKHLQLLYHFGVVDRPYDRGYRLMPQFAVAGQRALDFGHGLIRLDFAEQSKSG